MKEIIF